jgi:hypothetical protein
MVSSFADTIAITAPMINPQAGCSFHGAPFLIRVVVRAQPAWRRHDAFATAI